MEALEKVRIRDWSGVTADNYCWNFSLILSRDSLVVKIFNVYLCFVLSVCTTTTCVLTEVRKGHPMP